MNLIRASNTLLYTVVKYGKVLNSLRSILVHSEPINFVLSNMIWVGKLDKHNTKAKLIFYELDKYSWSASK